jgi:hypothetical protein
VSLSPLRRVGLLTLVAATVAAGTASGALVAVDEIVLRADGSFQPRTLPRDRHVPIEFEGRIDIDAKDGGRPSPLQQALIDFDHDGRLSVAGLPACAPETIAQASTEEARSSCRGAIVGSGHIEASVALPGGTVPASSELTIFNGPRLGSGPSALLHARFTVPATETYAVVVPIERRRGEFRYRARLDLPPIAGGLGALTHIDVEIGRRYRAGGRNRSYLAARCSDNILRTHGRFSFEAGTIVDGWVEKFCRSK